MARFDLRKSPVDGMIRKWETKMASEVEGLRSQEFFHDGSGDKCPDFYDYEVSVCTGVFKQRRDVFK